MAAPGLELLYSVALPEISRPQDALICFIHWELITRGFRCLGTGEQAGAQERGSERLPKSWASNKELYTLRYESSQSKVLLKALTVEGALMVNVMELQTEKVFDLTLNIADFINIADLQSFHGAYKNIQELKQRLQSELISPLLGPRERPSGRPERGERPAERDPLREPTRNPPLYQPSWEDPRGSFAYGAADLDPLGGLSGGMIFDPLHGRTRPRPDPLGGFPPGAVPPGARFDPIGPPGAGRPGPDPDHHPPPGYDDMFM